MTEHGCSGSKKKQELTKNRNKELWEKQEKMFFN